MFTDSSTLDFDKVARTLKSSLDKWAETSENWFDDSSYMASIDSVDRRIEKLNNIQRAARGAVSRFQSTGRMLEIMSHLEDESRYLASLKTDLLNGASGREDASRLSNMRPPKLSDNERRFVELEAQKFVRESMDDFPDRVELSERAYRHATVQVGTLPVSQAHRVVTAFVRRVDEMGSEIPRPQRVAATVRADFDDSLLFLSE